MSPRDPVCCLGRPPGTPSRSAARSSSSASRHPFLTRAAAEELVSAGPALVGIDSLNVDDSQDGARPVHTLLLAVGIPIIEHLRNLEKLPRDGFRLHAVPAPFRAVGSFPVRAYAILTG